MDCHQEPKKAYVLVKQTIDLSAQSATTLSDIHSFMQDEESSARTLNQEQFYTRTYHTAGFSTKICSFRNQRTGFGLAFEATLDSNKILCVQLFQEP